MGIQINYCTSKKVNTSRCFEEINTLLKSKKDANVILMVPEQYSSYYEQLLVDNSIEKGSYRAEILTFKRFSHRLFTRHLKINGRYIDNAGKSMLMYNVISSLGTKFEAFAKARRYPSFAAEALKTISEFKRYGVTPEIITETVTKTDSAFLGRKLNELSQIYKIYEKRLSEGGYKDGDDNLKELANLIEVDSKVKESYFWFDGYDGFTPVEMDVVRAVMNKAKQTNFSFCCDQISLPDIINVFYPVIKTAIKIEKTAKMLGINVRKNETKIVNTTLSDIPGEIEHLATNYFRYPGKRYIGSINYLSTVQSDSIYKEIVRCALEITRKVKRGEMRYGDISVVSGLYDEYRDYIEAVFNKFDIPTFMDEKRSIIKHPVASFLLPLLEIYISKYSYKSVFVFLKSSYSDISEDEISILENYVLKWGISGIGMWNDTDWDFYTDQSENEKKLELLNKIRKKIVNSLQPVFDLLKGGVNARTFITVIFNYLVGQGIFRKIEDDAKKADMSGDLDLSDELKQSWNILMDIFNQIFIIAGENKYTVEVFKNMLELGFSQKEIGIIPPRTDDVFVGRIEKAYGNSTKMLMVIGANDQGFPRKVVSEGLLTDKDRSKILQTGLELAPETKLQVIYDQINIYNLLNLPDRYIYFSYSGAGPDGTKRRKSGLFNRIEDLFENYSEEIYVEEDDYIVNMITGLEEVAARGDGLGDVSRYLRENGRPLFFANSDESIPDIGFDKIIRELLGDSLESSPTVIEKYTSCPYKYFAEIVLNAKPRMEFCISPPDFGSILHEILKKLVGEFIEDEIDDYDTYIVKAEDTFSNMKFSRIFERDKRYGHMGGRLVKRAVDSFLTLKRQVHSGDFNPIELEVAFGQNRQIKPPQISAGGHNIFLNGRIDRVDGAIINNQEYFRIIDYKSSQKDLKLYKINEGLDIQLASYLLAYQNHSGTKPAGMYYFNTKRKLLDIDYGSEISIKEQDLDENRRMEGYTLKNTEVVRAMDKNIEGSSRIIPVKYNKEKEEVSNKIIDEKDIEMMTKRVVELVSEKTKSIYNGEFLVSPVHADEAACLYCEFNNICGFDIRKNNCNYRYIKQVADKKVVWGKNE